MKNKIHTRNTKKRTATKNRTPATKFIQESDSQYLLKLVLVILLATFWIKFAAPVEWLGILLTALPIGLLLGLILIHTFEHQQIDRKIWYAVLIVVGIVGYFAPAGIII